MVRGDRTGVLEVRVRVPAPRPWMCLTASPSFCFLLCEGRVGTSDLWSRPAGMLDFVRDSAVAPEEARLPSPATHCGLCDLGQVTYPLCVLVPSSITWRW